MSEDIDKIIEALVKQGKIKTKIEFVEISKENLPDLIIYKIAYPELEWGYEPKFSFIFIVRTDIETAFRDVGFFYKSFCMFKWVINPFQKWFGKYKDKEEFLIDYPEAKQLFNNYPTIPVGYNEIKYYENGELNTSVGTAHFDGEYVNIITESGEKIQIEPSEIQSIKPIQSSSKEVDF